MKTVAWLLFIFGATALAMIAIMQINMQYLPAGSSEPIVIGRKPAPTPATAPILPGNTPATTTPPTLPLTLLLPVPFSAQAPTANWDQLHNEACEEASAIMADQYFLGNRNATLPADLVESEITKLTTWENQNFGYNFDTTDAETAQFMRQVYGLQTKLINNFSEIDIKTELSQHHLVMISADGRLLGNPNYKQPGPVHHMLLIRGYNEIGIITNDPGTRRGENYFYDFNTLYNAAGDWDHSTNKTDTTKKIMIVVWK